jgi:AcrR family transcriptional regulator
VAPSKGDQREEAILDAAEVQLSSLGVDRMTVETIATAVGITRGAFYFYFGSKNDVLAALVERTVARLRESVEAANAPETGNPGEALRRSVDLTARMWRQHGDVMRVAVELSPSVAAIEQHWNSTVEATTETTRQILNRAGLSDGGGPRDATALARALVWMTERSFYQAFTRQSSLEEVAETVAYVWLAVLPRGNGPAPDE